MKYYLGSISETECIFIQRGLKSSSAHCIIAVKGSELKNDMQ